MGGAKRCSKKASWIDDDSITAPESGHRRSAPSMAPAALIRDFRGSPQNRRIEDSLQQASTLSQALGYQVPKEFAEDSKINLHSQVFSYPKAISRQFGEPGLAHVESFAR
jgi:hypothetical protein